MTPEMNRASPFSLDPDMLPKVPEDFEGPCLIELTHRHRQGRGRWWRPDSNGYTDVFVSAGVYTAEQARRICNGVTHIYPIDALSALEIAEEQMREMRAKIDAVQ